MRTGFFVLLFVTAASGIVRGKFVKIENLHLKEANEKHNWNTDSGSTTSPRNRTMLRGGVHPYDVGGAAVSKVVGKAKLLQSVNELNLDGDMAGEGSAKKEWKSFYYPSQYHGHGVSGVPFGWSNGVINNNNLLNVGGYAPVGTAAAAVPGDLTTTTTVLKPGLGLGAGSTLQCILFSVMGLVTFLLNSVMALLLTVKLPAGLDGLLGGLLGSAGLGFGGFGAALTKQEGMAVDTKSKHLDYVHFPEHMQGERVDGPQNHENVDYGFDKN